MGAHSPEKQAAPLCFLGSPCQMGCEPQPCWWPRAETRSEQCQQSCNLWTQVTSYPGGQCHQTCFSLSRCLFCSLGFLRSQAAVVSGRSRLADGCRERIRVWAPGQDFTTQVFILPFCGCALEELLRGSGLPVALRTARGVCHGFRKSDAGVFQLTVNMSHHNPASLTVVILSASWTENVCSLNF